MLTKLENFTEWSRMEINVSKCATASYLIDEQRHRCILEVNFRLTNEPVPNLTMSQSLKYLGTAVAARRTVKLQTVEGKVTEIEKRLQSIISSKLLIVQKIDAIKTFLLPSLDCYMLNGEIERGRLTKLDQKIRGEINKEMKIRGLPVECHHSSWRDGGLSYPSRYDRSEVLTIRSFTQMVLSQDDQVRRAMRQFIEDERNFRRIELDEDGQFRNWREKKRTIRNIINHSKNGTSMQTSRDLP
jgi:hypothetical protein